MAGLLRGALKSVDSLVDDIANETLEAIEATGETIESIGRPASGSNKKKKKNNKNKRSSQTSYVNEDDEDKQVIFKKIDADEDDENDSELRDEAELKLTIPKGEKQHVVYNTDDEDKDEDDGEYQIPRHFSLISSYNGKYLRYINEDDKKTQGFLKFSGEKLVSPFSKFAVHTSKIDRGLVHIKCCYNNKFLVRLSSNSEYIVAKAHEQEEDKTKWSCTLFEPLFDHSKQAYQFRHVQLHQFVYVGYAEPAPYTNCLVSTDFYTKISSNSESDHHRFSTFVDWDSIFILPKHVAFKGNNGQYLKPSGNYLQFGAEDTDDPAISFEVLSTKDGHVRIRHVDSGKYWCRDTNWILLKSIDTSKNDSNALFWPVKFDDNILAFRNKANNLYIKRLSFEEKTNCLNASVRTISNEAHMEVTEIVAARSIEDVEYHLNNARVYGKKVLTISKGVAINNTKVADKLIFRFRHENKFEKTWGSSLSKNFGLAVRFTSKIPTVGTLKGEFSYEHSSENSWGNTETDESFEQTTQTVTVPPMSKVNIAGIITQASCDVPFSYTRRDTLKNGKQVRHRLEDGLFTGVSTFDFKYETEKLPL